jgi:hypothetical protein
VTHDPRQRLADHRQRLANTLERAELEHQHARQAIAMAESLPNGPEQARAVVVASLATAVSTMSLTLAEVQDVLATHAELLAELAHAVAPRDRPA